MLNTLFFTLGLIMPGDFDHSRAIQEPVPIKASDSLTLMSIVESLHESIETQQEKVYLHCDKEYYTNGETLFYKAYVLDSDDHKLINYQTVLFVDLFYGDTLITRQKLKVLSGFTYGSFRITDIPSSGKLLIRAYTPWMLNFPEEYMFSKEISVYSQETTANLSDSSGDSIELKFFPEGGYLIENIVGQLGFKAETANGKGIKVTGSVSDESGQIVAAFESNHLGLGSIFFKHEVGKKYYATINDNSRRYPLPEAKSAGLSCIFRHVGMDKIFASFNASNINEEESYYLIGQSRGTVYYAGLSKITNGAMVFEIEKESFPEGVCQFTLLDGNGKPMLERLIYIFNNDHKQQHTDIQITGNIKAREKLEVNVDISPSSLVRLDSANLSISVTDHSLMERDELSTNIRNYLLLHSDLRGNIESPNYYFTQIDRKKKLHLDYLMLTQGWRRYSWSSILSDKEFESTYLHEYGNTLTGSIENANRSKPMTNISLDVMHEDNLFTISTDEKGDFTLDGQYFYEGDSLVFLEDGKVNNKMAVEFDEYEIPLGNVEYDHRIKNLDESKSRYVREDSLRTKIRESYGMSENVIELDPFTFEESSLENSQQVSTLYGDPDIKLKLDDRLRAINDIFSILRTRVPGLRIVGPYGQEQIQIRGIGTFGGSSNPIILYDGSIIYRPNSTGSIADALSFVNVMDLDRIEVIKGAGITAFGRQGANGAIALYSRSGIGTITKGIDLDFVKVPGYHKPVEFYHPNHAEMDDPQPDRRVTLYWNPIVYSDNQGKVSFEFYNNDVTKEFEIVIEGISTSGEPVFIHEIVK